MTVIQREAKSVLILQRWTLSMGRGNLKLPEADSRSAQHQMSAVFSQPLYQAPQPCIIPETRTLTDPLESRRRIFRTHSRRTYSRRDMSPSSDAYLLVPALPELVTV